MECNMFICIEHMCTGSCTCNSGMGSCRGHSKDLSVR